MSSETVTDKIGSITGSALFRRVVITLILFNAIIVGLDTYPQIHARYGKILHLTDRIILWLVLAGVSSAFSWVQTSFSVFSQWVEPLRFDHRGGFVSAVIGIFHGRASFSHSSRAPHRQRVA